MAETVKTRRTRKAGAPTTPDPIEIAMEAEASGSLTDPARQVLVEQLQLIRTQTQLGRWQIISERAGAALKVGTGLVALAAAGVVGLMIWTASRADGLVIRPFSTPPGLAQRGVTGEALAAQLMDRMGRMSDLARSSEQQQQVVAAQSDNVSIQIPETGISVSQLEQWLKEKVGRERRITGELAFAPDGRLVLTSRIGGTALDEQRGREIELPAMLQRAAEQVMAKEQPSTYRVFLSRSERWDELRRFAEARLLDGSARDRALSFYTLSGPNLAADDAERRRYLQLAIQTDPKAVSAAYDNLAGVELNAGHDEAAYRLFEQRKSLYADPKAFLGASPEARAQAILSHDARLAGMLHDHNAALTKARELSRRTLLGFAVSFAPEAPVINQLAALHDITGARAVLSSFRPRNDQQKQQAQWVLPMAIAVAAEDWPAAIAAWEGGSALPQNLGRRANAARALVHLGRIAEAEALISPTPLDCVPCVVVRGEIAEAKSDPRLADHWLVHTTRMAPSLADAPYRYGQVLLLRGDLRGAVAQFRDANTRAPRWAEPIVGWGEALLAQGDAKGAAARFKAAEKLAPKWGRLHLKWGEALAKQGKTAEAGAKWKLAATLDLTPSERADLQRLMGGARG